MIRKTAIARSVALAFGMAAVGVWVAPAAYAQSNTTGSIYGTVDSAAGSEVLIENKETGFKRTIRPDANGRFNIPSVPTGTYTVSLVRNGQVVTKQEGIEVRISQGSEVALVAGSTQTVQIRASRIAKIDTTSATSAAVFTSKDLERLPVAGNVGAIIQLAPNTTKGDSRYGGVGAPSFGGASASENSYYINGFPVTTLLTQVGFSQLPFNSIGQAQVLTGGYGAEFGRSTGGVVNIITKRGGNDWEVGGAVTFEPRSMRARERDMLFEPTLASGGAFNGKYRFYNGLNTDERTVVSAYAGGPIMKDKLFFYGAVEQTKRTRDSVRLANTSATYATGLQTQAFEEREVQIPRYLLKLDWAITDNYTVEYTRIEDKVKDTRKYYGFNYATLQRNSIRNGGVSFLNWGPTPVASQQGAEVDILKATGYITDDITLTALVGRTKTPHEQAPTGYIASLPQIAPNGSAPPGINIPTPQGAVGNLLTPGAQDENKGARFDVEWKLNSSHKLRAGIDANKIDSKAGTSTAGGSLWTYFKTNTPLTFRPYNTANPVGQGAAPGSLQEQGYYAEQSRFSAASTPTVKQDAWYVEDQWQLTKDLLLILGLRNEGFENQNGDKQTYVKLDKQYAPRIAAIWDLKGDASSVLKGTVGRYHVPLPTNVAVRAAGSSYNARTAYGYTGVDPVTGAPTGLTAIGPLFSSNNEYGQAKDPRQVAAIDMKGNYQDELTLGIEQAVAKGWTGSAKFTYRSLKTALDDHCDDRPFIAWAGRNGITMPRDADGAIIPFYNCALFNPGLANRFTIDLDGDGRLEDIRLSAADLGIIKPKRTYMALDLGLEHPFDGKWWLKVNYTLARNKGNAEGQLLSDIGQGDVATTQAYDFPEFSQNANGLLPNDRKHQIKIFGYYQVLQEWGVGGNFVYSSGRPKNCIGNAPTDVLTTPSPVPGADPIPDYTPYSPGRPVTDYAGYGSAYFFCNGQPSPRGSQGRLPAEMTIDLNIKFEPSFLPGLRLQADMFNVFNRQVAEVIEERFNNGGPRNTYGAVQSYSAPRSVKFTVAYDKKF